jgi:hypothetical protein
LLLSPVAGARSPGQRDVDHLPPTLATYTGARIPRRSAEGSAASTVASPAAFCSPTPTCNELDWPGCSEVEPDPTLTRKETNVNDSAVTPAPPWNPPKPEQLPFLRLSLLEQLANPLYQEEVARATFPGTGWQQLWCVSGADTGKEWIDELTADDPRSVRQKRSEIHHGLACLLACRIILPGYAFIAAYTPLALHDNIRATVRPDALTCADADAVGLGIIHRPRKEALLILVKIVMHTGKDLDQLTEADVHTFRDWHLAREGRTKFGLHAAWDILVEIDVLPKGTSLRRSSRQGQHRTSHLVDRYQITCRPVRDLLVRYLEERRPSMDYASLATLATLLARTFWADIDKHHPGIDYGLRRMASSVAVNILNLVRPAASSSSGWRWA